MTIRPTNVEIDRSFAIRVHDAVEAAEREEARELIAEAVPAAPELFVAALVADMRVFVIDADDAGVDSVEVVEEMLDEFAAAF